MARFLAHANVGVHAIRLIGVKTIIDITTMAALPTTVLGVDVQIAHRL
jgi:hypothetical protein